MAWSMDLTIWDFCIQSGGGGLRNWIQLILEYILWIPLSTNVEFTYDANQPGILKPKET